MTLLQITALIFELIAPNPRHPLHRNAEELGRLALEIRVASESQDVPPKLLTHWCFGESTFLKDAKRTEKSGAVSRGYMQTHSTASALCRKAGYEPGSISCGAYLMSYGRELCGSLERGLWWYASGRCEGTPRAKRITKFRMRKAGIK